ncbi:cytochrome b6-f complex iron-sulfur subunit [Flagellimonas taeanensis]|uniref:Cytochrome b6-f complex iron-sulfur subunit n=1 Tax=Flagellimonas taeanensis TaxID=1005926 RepID=A0A1M7B6I4_9FLAO|nr:ubiquinol-cytochrome c reductase iron-sulfur subunit [Allomuricauda taeanensis]SFC38081.1 cytochrome b6-f complex iron-sulfur subunit [Allomuricauda taeanensis]SHL50557.1 cytochrome b6-f complex iron-sulfur subunit [Allomuricauda taeanensis]
MAVLPASSALLSSCTGLYYGSFVEEGGVLRVSKGEFQQVKGEKQIERDFVVIRGDSMRYPIGIFKTPNNHYMANLMQCTHKGCELSIGGGIFNCPCHGSEFDPSGRVLEGPAEENLKSFEITADNENIYVHGS